jgi:hypothetical protein
MPRITFQPDRFTSKAFMNAEALIASLAWLKPETVQESNMEFGGGVVAGFRGDLAAPKPQPANIDSVEFA